MKNIQPLEFLNRNSVETAGGKAASLGELKQIGLPVPNGFVILSDAFDCFIAELDIKTEIDALLDKIDGDKMGNTRDTSRIVRSLILKSELPEDIEREIRIQFRNHKMNLVAVRSSATDEDSLIASWAGELDTYLNVNESSLNKSIRECWASLFSPRAIHYRMKQKKDRQKNSIAVVVQQMIQSEVSGTVFTAHPASKDRNQMIIEAGYGLGEAVVGGLITPDSYIIDKQTDDIIEINISKQITEIVCDHVNGTKKIPVAEPRSKQKKLTDDQIMELAKTCTRIEQHYGQPQDIEWALMNDQFQITQSRPITNL